MLTVRVFIRLLVSSHFLLTYVIDTLKDKLWLLLGSVVSIFFWYLPLLIMEFITLIVGDVWGLLILTCPFIAISYSDSSCMMIFHVSHKLLPSLLICSEYQISLTCVVLPVLHLHIYWCIWTDLVITGLFVLVFRIRHSLWLGIYLYFLLVNVLLQTSIIVISVVEIVILGYPLVLFLLLFNVILSLLHVHKHFLKLLILLVFLSLHLVILNVVSYYILWWLHLFNLKVDDSAANLYSLCNRYSQRQPLSYQYQCAKFWHVVLKVESIVFESNDSMTSADTNVIDSEVTVMPSPESSCFHVLRWSKDMDHTACVLLETQGF